VWAEMRDNSARERKVMRRRVRMERRRWGATSG
jgi:hypothetical protein